MSHSQNISFKEDQFSSSFRKSLKYIAFLLQSLCDGGRELSSAVSPYPALKSARVEGFQQEVLVKPMGS